MKRGCEKGAYLPSGKRQKTMKPIVDANVKINTNHEPGPLDLSLKNTIICVILEHIKDMITQSFDLNSEFYEFVKHNQQYQPFLIAFSNKLKEILGINNKHGRFLTIEGKRLHALTEFLNALDALNQDNRGLMLAFIQQSLNPKNKHAKNFSPLIWWNKDKLAHINGKFKQFLQEKNKKLVIRIKA